MTTDPNCAEACETFLRGDRASPPDFAAAAEARLEAALRLAQRPVEALLANRPPHPDQPSSLAEELLALCDFDHVGLHVPLPVGLCALSAAPIREGLELLAQNPFVGDRVAPSCEAETAHVAALLRRLGLVGLQALPSYVVARRLLRHDRLRDRFGHLGVPTMILRARLPGPPRTGLEAFVTRDLDAREACQELKGEAETHFALKLKSDSGLALVSRLLVRAGFEHQDRGANAVEKTTLDYYLRSVPFCRVEVIRTQPG